MTGHVNDHKLAALQSLLSISGGNIDDLEKAWLISESSTFDHINNMWLELFQGHGASADQYNTAAYEFLTGMGHSGALNDMWHDYWFAGGGLPGGPWEYATLALAESSGDPWVNGDQVTITGGAVFTYLSAIAVDGYSGLIHKYPYDGTGTLGTISASVAITSESEGTDPDSWADYVDLGTVTQGVNFDYDVDGGLARFFVTTLVGSARKDYNGEPPPAATESFLLMEKMSAFNDIAGTVRTRHLISLRSHVGAADLRYIRLDGAESGLDDNWYINHTDGTTFTDTGIDRTNSNRLWVYVKNGRWAMWLGSNSVPEISGSVPRTLTSGSMNEMRVTRKNVIDSYHKYGRHVLGRMTTA